MRSNLDVIKVSAATQSERRSATKALDRDILSAFVPLSAEEVPLAAAPSGQAEDGPGPAPPVYAAAATKPATASLLVELGISVQSDGLMWCGCLLPFSPALRADFVKLGLPLLLHWPLLR